MSDNELNQAIQLIQQGQNEQAQVILQGLIRANQQDLAAWSWYVKSCRTPEKRLETLELSLRFNPGNPQIIEAIRKMREKLAPVPVPSYPQDIDPKVFLSARQPSSSSSVQNPEPVYQPEDDRGEGPIRFLGLDDVAGRPLMWWDVWWLAVRYPSEEMYTALLRDPLANIGRAVWWVFLTSMLLWLISLFNPALLKAVNDLEKMRGGKEIGTLIGIGTLLAIPFGAVINILLLMISSAFYTVLAKMFGGTGNFTRTFYLMSAYRAPLDILIGILPLIPCGNLVVFALSAYMFRLQIATVQAAHRLNGLRATLVVAIPVGILLIASCLLGVAFATTLSHMRFGGR